MCQQIIRKLFFCFILYHAFNAGKLIVVWVDACSLIRQWMKSNPSAGWHGIIWTYGISIPKWSWAYSVSIGAESWTRGYNRWHEPVPIECDIMYYLTTLPPFTLPYISPFRSLLDQNTRFWFSVLWWTLAYCTNTDVKRIKIIN